MKSNLVFDGIVIKAFYGSDKFDKDEKYRLTIKSDNIPYTDITVFDGSGSRFTPTWLKDANGYISLKSIYDIPVKLANGRESTFQEWIESGTAKGSEVRCKIVQKISRGNGSVYPVAIKVLNAGLLDDPFEDM